MPNEADTCRRYVVPKLQAAGWEDEPHRLNEQVTFTDGRIVVTGRHGRRRPGKRAGCPPRMDRLPRVYWALPGACRGSLLAEPKSDRGQPASCLSAAFPGSARVKGGC